MPEQTGDVPERLIVLGASIRNLRKSQGMNQQQLSEATKKFGNHTGVGWTTIKELENPKKDRHSHESTLGDLSEALGEERSYLGEIDKGLRPGFESPEPEPKPRAKPKAEDYLKEISEWMSAVDQRLASVNKRLDRIDTALGLAPRPDVEHRIAANPPETES